MATPSTPSSIIMNDTPNPMPALSTDELSALRTSIERDGIIYPVILDRDGNIIDGFHRTAIAKELGIECPTHTLLVEPARATELRVILNLARRQLTTEHWYTIVKAIAEPHVKAIKADESQRRSTGTLHGLEGLSVRQTIVPPDNGRVELANRVNADLKAMGLNRTVAPSTVDNIARYGTSNPSRDKARTRKTAPKRDPRITASEESMLRIRQSNALDQYESMMNAPKAKLNLPLIRIAEQVQPLLVELTALDPEVALTQIPIERCRQWQPEHARWWLRFTELCAERLAREAPDLPPVRYPKRTKLVMKTDTPTEEYQLSPLQGSVLGWLQQQSQPKFILEIAAGILAQRTSVLGALKRLEELGFVRKTGVHARSQLFEVVPKEHAAEEPL